MLLLFVKMVSVIFKNVKKDIQKFANTIETTEDVNLRWVVDINMKTKVNHWKVKEKDKKVRTEYGG